jgi:hypothetical protein
MSGDHFDQSFEDMRFHSNPADHDGLKLGNMHARQMLGERRHCANARRAYPIRLSGQ